MYGVEASGKSLHLSLLCETLNLNPIHFDPKQAGTFREVYGIQESMS